MEMKSIRIRIRLLLKVFASGLSLSSLVPLILSGQLTPYFLGRGCGTVNRSAENMLQYGLPHSRTFSQVWFQQQLISLVNSVNHVCRQKVDWLPGSSVCKIWLETPSWPHISLSLCVQVLTFDILFVKYCKKTSTEGAVRVKYC